MVRGDSIIFTQMPVDRHAGKPVVEPPARLTWGRTDVVSLTTNCMHNVSTFFGSPLNLGPEGALFQHSVETPLVKAEPFKDLR